MILNFADRQTERLWRREPTWRFPPELHRPMLRRLRLLQVARRLEDLRVPSGNRLEKLHGDRMGQYSIRVNRRWRVCFGWTGTDAVDVEIVDYH